MVACGRIRIRNIVLALAGISLLTHAAAAQPARPQPVPANRQAEEIEESALPLVAAPLAFKVGAVVVKASIGAYRVYGTAATAKAAYDYIQSRRKPIKPKINPRPGVIPKRPGIVVLPSPATTGPKDFPTPRNDIASNATPIVSTDTKERHGSGGNPPPEEDPKRRCSYAEWPKTMAYPAAPAVLASTDKMDRLIIRENIGTDEKPGSADPAKWSQDAGIPLKVLKGPLLGAYLVQLPRKYTASELSDLIFKMFIADATRSLERKGCRYRYVDPDFVLHRLQENPTPNDLHFIEQWHLRGAPFVGARFNAAWRAMSDWKRAQPDHAFRPITIAIIDDAFVTRVPSGSRQELDFLPGFNTADHSTNVECTDPAGCHGTEVASILGARANNRFAVAGALGVGLGLGWDSGVFSLLPIVYLERVTGTNGISRDDFSLWGASEGVLYASGYNANLIPALPSIRIPATPAKVISMSLGFPGVCDNLISRATRKAIDKGAILIAAAGNRMTNLTTMRTEVPASCPGVIAVVGHDKAGEPGIDMDNRRKYRPYFAGKDGGSISAPGGDVPRFSKYVSAFTPAATAVVRSTPEIATSYATPQVAATVAMMLSIRPSLTGPEVLQILRETGTPAGPPPSRRKHPALNADAAVRAVINMPFGLLRSAHPPSPPDSPRPETPRITRTNTMPMNRDAPTSQP